MKTSFK